MAIGAAAPVNAVAEALGPVGALAVEVVNVLRVGVEVVYPDPVALAETVGKAEIRSLSRDEIKTSISDAEGMSVTSGMRPVRAGSSSERRPAGSVSS